jgi:hypothetical protein
MPDPLARAVWSKRGNQDTMVAMAGGLEAAAERIASPYKPYEPEYVWNEESCRYHWRRDVEKGGKKFRKGSFHRVPNIPHEKKLYAERLKRRKDSRRMSSGIPGSRLKQRS